MFVSLSCTVTVQETTASSLKPSLLRTSFAPQKGPRRSLDVSTHVLATQVAPQSDPHPQPVPKPAGVKLEAAPHAYWSPTWTKALQTKFLAVWDKWQKLSAQISQYKAMRPDWVGMTQEVFDQQFQRFLSSVGAAAAARSTAATAAAKQRSGSTSAVAARPVTLTPYLTVADEVEVSFAAMLADLCNMAYEVDKLDPELLEARHRLSLIASSLSCAGPAAAACATSAAADETTTSTPALAAAAPTAALLPSGAARTAAIAIPGAADGTETDAEPHDPHHTPGNIVSFTMGGSPPLSPAISMLQLTSPEAVTAALTSAGHGAAFAHPVYVSTLHHSLGFGLTSLGSYDEEGDISDLEWRAAMAAAGPAGALLVGAGPGGGASPAGKRGAGPEIGSLGTIATLDTELLMEGDAEQVLLLQKPTEAGNANATAMAALAAGMRDQRVVAQGVDATHTSGTVATMDLVSVTQGDAVGVGKAAAPSGVFFSDVPLTEERDFVSGHVYGYKTKLVERRLSSDGGAGGESVTAAVSAAMAVAAGEVEAVTVRRGAAGGRALRAEQEQSGRRRRSSASGGGAGSAGAAAIFAAGEVAGVEMGTETEDELRDAAMANVPPVVVASARAPPSAWFSVDDKLSKTRYFVIQGSTSLEHWQINFQFEPVIFEDEKYGVRVHRGVYEAAKVMYEDLLPLVKQHMETSPYATVSFSGHSLGGSLGTVLMLLFVARGVLQPANISPVYTFGSPAIFCQGAVPNAPPDRCSTCTLSCHMRNGAGVTADGRAAVAAGAAGSAAADVHPMQAQHPLPVGLLASLGLSEDQVVNVIMHKDVVPRAFVCDYTAVAGVLHRWWPSLREHQERQGAAVAGANGGKGEGGGDGGGSNGGAAGHKSLYNFVGRVAVLRPSGDLPFVNGPADAAHPMLPNHPALYRVGLHDDPSLPLTDASAASLASWDELLLEGLSAVSATFSSSGANSGGAAAGGGGCRRRNAAAAAAEAKRAAKVAGMQRTVLDFMNQPHPLTTLGDYQAYGPNGCISRFHNPDNYTRALTALLTR